MAHVTPADRDTVVGLDGVFAAVESTMGFLPNSMLTMAHMPQLPMAFMMLASVAFGGDLKGLVAAFGNSVPDQGEPGQNIPPSLVQLVAFASSVASGCRYCQAHTAHSAHRLGESEDKLGGLLDYETRPDYNDGERAAVALALAAGQVPNAVEETHFEALRRHFSERQIVQIVAVVAVFGFLNRWNDTMGTMLESAPVGFADRVLAGLGWTPGKHR